MRALDLEMIRESGKGGFRTVCESQNLAERLKVADSNVLASILNEIGAADFLEVFIDDGLGDDALWHLSRLKLEII